MKVKRTATTRCFYLEGVLAAANRSFTTDSRIRYLFPGDAEGRARPGLAPADA